MASFSSENFVISAFFGLLLLSHPNNFLSIEVLGCLKSVDLMVWRSRLFVDRYLLLIKFSERSC